jgi:hypothetical protein
MSNYRAGDTSLQPSLQCDLNEKGLAYCPISETSPLLTGLLGTLALRGYHNDSTKPETIPLYHPLLITHR